MEKIPCSMIKDLLPLYIDHVLSTETEQFVKAHLQTCENCQKEYETMTHEFVMPDIPKVQEENKKTLLHLKRQIQMKRIIAAMIGAALTIILVLSAYLVYTNVGAVQNFFQENTMVVLREMNTDKNWVPLEVDETGYLNFDTLFCKKEIVVDIASDNAVAFRINDTEGNIIIDNLVVQPGTSASLKELKRNTDYKVEIQTNAEFVCIHFS